MKKTLKLGSYIVERENGYLKVSHENKSWNFRIAATPENIAEFFDNCKDDEKRRYYEVVFAGTQTFTILGLQSPQYMEAWMNWHNAYFANLEKEITPEQNEQILAEEKVLHEMREEAGKETETKTEE